MSCNSRLNFQKKNLVDEVRNSILVLPAKNILLHFLTPTLVEKSIIHEKKRALYNKNGLCISSRFSPFSAFLKNYNLAPHNGINNRFSRHFEQNIIKKYNF